MKKNKFSIKKGKSKKHDSIVNDFDNQKRKHLEKLANKMLDIDKRNQLLKDKKINNDFLKNF
jgi:hypothetical protein